MIVNNNILRTLCHVLIALSIVHNSSYVKPTNNLEGWCHFVDEVNAAERSDIPGVYFTIVSTLYCNHMPLPVQWKLTGTLLLEIPAPNSAGHI